MSGSDYAGTQDEIAGMLGMSRRQFGEYAKRLDAPRKTKSGYNVNQWRKYVNQVREEGLTGDGSLRDEKIKREIRRLDIQIQKDLGELVNHRDAERDYLNHLSQLRKVIEDWRGHETAKDPVMADRINSLSDRLIDHIRSRGSDES